MSEVIEAPAGTRYISVDELPEIAQARQQVRDQAWDMVRLRERQLSSDEKILVPLEVDALSTAERVIGARSRYGEDSEIYLERLAGLELDCRRLVAEWYRKKRPEYFPAARHFFDAETGDFYSHGLSIRQMTENALRPIDDDPEEVGRRVNERVEDATPNIIRKVGGLALQQVGIRTISECTDKAVRDYQADVAAGAPHRGYKGYVPEIEKLMVRDMRFDGVTGDRLEEQIGLPGIFINHYVIQEALRRRDVETSGMDKTELHGTQLLVNDDLIEFVELLDTVASEEWCTNIFMGEEVPADNQKNYAAIREEALHRQEGLQDMAATVSTFIIDLAEDGVDRRKAPAKVESFVKKLLLETAKSDVSLAAQIFDERTAKGLQEVVYLNSVGRHAEAFSRFLEVEKLAPGDGYCGGGSCGLESVDIFSREGKELKQALRAEDGDTIVKDKERSCKCGRKAIVYAYNKNKVNKYCEGCKAFESKITKAAT
jgi:hypothetical protein